MAASASRRYTQGRASLTVVEDTLPSGSCNFRDLNLGARAKTCGCKRFWLNNSHAHGHHDGESFCFCGHHACFHDAFTAQKVQESGRLLSRTELGASIHLSDRKPTVTEFVPTAEKRTPSRQSKEPPAGLGIQPGSSSQPHSISTRVWQALNDFARKQEDGNTSDTGSKLPSTAAPSVVEVDNFSPNRIIQERLQIYRPMGPPWQVPPNITTAAPTEEYSATEVATPSIAGTPDFHALAHSSSPTRVSPAYLAPARLQPRLKANSPLRDETHAAAPGSVPAQPLSARPPEILNHMSLTDMQSMLRDFGRRLGDIESLSFNTAPVDEIRDQFELVDGRLIDLEQWRADQEQTRASPEVSQHQPGKKRRLLPNETTSFESDDSFDLSAAAHTEAVVLATLAANAETNPRIEDLESRVANLEDRALPSFARPWEVQVVFLPWGRDLRGIWFSAEESTHHSARTTQMSEEWSLAQSTAPLSFNTSFGGGWTTESIEAWANEAHEWLSPKACGPTGVVFQRLKSRGLVRTVRFTSPDSRHILGKIREAFNPSGDAASDVSAEIKRFQAMSERFIPLRKVRKSSRLRFLSPSEMVTSAIWTASFLDSGVLMKIKDDQRRLYITTPEAYIQPTGAGWSWQKIRELLMFDATGEEEEEAQANNLAIEACWTYNDALDHAASFNSSSSRSHESQWSTRSQVADQDNSNDEQQPMSPWSEAQRLHRRTLSLPSSHLAIEAMRDIVPKRRVASFETGASSVPPLLASSTSAENLAKRRRVSESPAIERRGVNFTPRWSREPPSPFTSEVAAEAKSQGTRRGATPFAYATPHSNSNIVVHLDSLVGDGGDTEADTEVVAPRQEAGEDEWDGMDEDAANVDEVERSSGGSEQQDADEAEDDESDSGSDDGVQEHDDDGFGIYLG